MKKYGSKFLCHVLPTVVAALLLSSCVGQQPKITLSPTINENVSENMKVLPDYLRLLSFADTKRNPYRIVVLNQTNDKVTFELQGWFASSGLRGYRLEMIPTQSIQSIDANSLRHQRLLLTYQMNLKYIGKEGGWVDGNNFSQSQTINISKETKEIQLTLIDGKGKVLAQEIVPVD